MLCKTTCCRCSRRQHKPFSMIAVVMLSRQSVRLWRLSLEEPARTQRPSLTIMTLTAAVILMEMPTGRADVRLAGATVVAPLEDVGSEVAEEAPVVATRVAAATDSTLPITTAMTTLPIQAGSQHLSNLASEAQDRLSRAQAATTRPRALVDTTMDSGVTRAGATTT